MKLQSIQKTIIKNKITEFIKSSEGNPNSEWPKGDTIKRIYWSKIYSSGDYFCVSFTTHIENSLNDIWLNIDEHNSEILSIVRDKRLKQILS